MPEALSIMSNHSVSEWLEEVKQGNEDAAYLLWNRYSSELLRVARRKLRGTPRRMEDEEDVALSAFDSFFKAADEGRFPDLNDRA